MSKSSTIDDVFVIVYLFILAMVVNIVNVYDNDVAVIIMMIGLYIWLFLLFRL